ncbi:uncharacterized protein DUF4157 [Cereibacter ovatus]|uniref:Uncharacterized protein DUF4157 n=1 Tax=Cereibacter ovatus TaxID=439529 RepID=A0A285CVM9_9RHOB|nr:DUF4157 domain-containing protein [Cereibacter ovatus]SNX71086.1 uncharacterized protein DUF4157 [Cereibacter ovatus]
MAHSFLSDRGRTGARSGSVMTGGRKAEPDARTAALKSMATGSAQVQALHALTDRAAVQRAGLEEEEPLQGHAIQRAGPEEEEPLQGHALQAAGQDGKTALQAMPDSPAGGLPAGLRSGIESLSGQSMEGVRVHRNSAQPARVGAHAFAQGHDIHLAPGQDHHLPHEAWHVVQQAAGRVAPTTEVAGVPVNDSPALEQEADRMGAKAARRT